MTCALPLPTTATHPTCPPRPDPRARCSLARRDLANLPPALVHLLDGFVTAAVFSSWEAGTLWHGPHPWDEEPMVWMTRRTPEVTFGAGPGLVYGVLRDMADQWRARPEYPAMRAALDRYVKETP